MSQNTEAVPLQMVGGCTFGRFPKISDAQTFNFIVSDGALVPYAGYKEIKNVDSAAVGRGIYSSTAGNIVLFIVGDVVYTMDASLNITAVVGGILESTIGDVFIAENNNSQIVITDKRVVYVYNWSTGVFSSSGIIGGVTWPAGFVNTQPGYISYQNGSLIIALEDTQSWVLSTYNDALIWVDDTDHVGELQSKPCFIKAAVPVPGGGNNILLLGQTVGESWQFTGKALFPYQRNSTFNVDYGCLNASSIAELENFIVWLAVNEQSGPVIMMTQGTSLSKISTDGIDFKFSKLTNPNNCSGFLFKQDGHLIYQFVFPDDNLSYAYDFNSKLFFVVTDSDMTYHIARQVVFYQNDYYFVSIKSGGIFRFGTQYTDAEYIDGTKALPRVRIIPPIRLPSQKYFIIRDVGFTVSNGQPNQITTVSYQPVADGIFITTEGGTILVTEGDVEITTEANASTPVIYESRSEAIDLSISRDGGESFGSSMRIEMNKVGKYTSRMIFQKLGIANDCTLQFKFTGFKRFVVFDGEVNIYG